MRVKYVNPIGLRIRTARDDLQAILRQLSGDTNLRYIDNARVETRGQNQREIIVRRNSESRSNVNGPVVLLQSPGCTGPNGASKTEAAVILEFGWVSRTTMLSQISWRCREYLSGGGKPTGYQARIRELFGNSNGEVQIARDQILNLIVKLDI